MEQVTGICMMRNEADVAAAVVRHMLAECDTVIVADNASTDGTRDILLGIDDARLTVVDEPGFAYYQQPKMNRLAEQAAEAGATWVVPFDADEWWYALNGRPICEVLDGLGVEVSVAETYNVVPQPDDPPEANPFRRALWADRSLGMQKVAFRPGPGRVLAMGNHHLEGYHHQAGGQLAIRHLRYRSLEQAKAKLRWGKAALEATDLSPHLGYHWRELGAMDDFQFQQWWDRYVNDSTLIRLAPLP